MNKKLLVLLTAMLLVGASAKAVNVVIINGTGVSSSNNDVLGDGGSVAYNATTNTLTLTNATIAATASPTSANPFLGACIVSAGDTFTLVVNGTNTLTSANNYGILSGATAMLIKGTGTLNVTGKSGIYQQPSTSGTSTIIGCGIGEGVTLNAEGTAGAGLDCATATTTSGKITTIHYLGGYVIGLSGGATVAAKGTTAAVTASELTFSAGYGFIEPEGATWSSHTVKVDGTTVQNEWVRMGYLGIPVDADHFPDSYFRSYISSQFDTDGNGYLSDSEVANATYIYLSNGGSGYDGRSIGSMQGIEYLTELTSFSLYGNTSLTSLDLSANTKLQEIILSGNSKLESVDVSGCTELTSFTAQFNTLLASVDVSGLSQLTYLRVIQNGNITALNASGCTALANLALTGGGTFHTLNLENCSSLTSLDLRSANYVTTLNIDGCTALETLNLSGNTHLAKLNIASLDALTTLNLSGCSALQELYCVGTTGNTQSTVKGGALTSLDLTGCSSLHKLNCSNNHLAALDLTDCTALDTLILNKTSLTSLDLSGRTGLLKVECYGSGYTNTSFLTNVNVSGCSALTQLSCYSNDRLTSLNLTGCSALESLNCGTDSLVSIDLSDCASLTYLNVAGNRVLASLDVSGCPLLSYISCESNAIQGAAMDALVASLPDRTAYGTSGYGEVHVWYTGTDNNTYTNYQSKKALRRGWKMKRNYYNNWHDVPTLTRGDVTDDGVVDVNDVAALANYMLGKPTEGVTYDLTDVEDAADVNESSSVSVADITALVNKLK